MAERLLRTSRHWRDHGWHATRRLIERKLWADVAGSDYARWIRLYDHVASSDRLEIARHCERLARRPVISLLVTIGPSAQPHLVRALNSVAGQIYRQWQLCVCLESNAHVDVVTAISSLQARDPRVMIATSPADQSRWAALSAALALATGDWIGLMKTDAVLPPHALYRLAVEANTCPDANIIYTDEDRIDEYGRRHDPYFKPDWNPDLLLGQNLMAQLGVVRHTLVKDIGGFRPACQSAQDYDLILRAVEKAHASTIRHVPSILYHDGAAAGAGTKGQSRDAADLQSAVADHLTRCAIPAGMEPVPGPEVFARVRFAVPEPQPLVSLIVPTRDRVELLTVCVEGVLRRTDYLNLELLILDNDSRAPETLAYFEQLGSDPRVQIIQWPGAFNYAAMNNDGVAQARGSVIGLLNNDIEVIEPGWLTEMVAHAVRPDVGAVGAKLSYPDGTIQHAGVVIGIGGVADHVHRGASRTAAGYGNRLRLTQNVSCVSAACLLTRKSVFQEVGGLDAQNLAVAFNDVDFCLRVRERGYLITWTPHAALFHHESASRGSDMTPARYAHFMAEVAYMKARWGTRLGTDPYYNPNLTLDACNAGLAFPPRAGKPWLEQDAEAN